MPVHPTAQSTGVDVELARHRRDRPLALQHHADGFFLELRRGLPATPRHVPTSSRLLSAYVAGCPESSRHLTDAYLRQRSERCGHPRQSFAVPLTLLPRPACQELRSLAGRFTPLRRANPACTPWIHVGAAGATRQQRRRLGSFLVKEQKQPADRCQYPLSRLSREKSTSRRSGRTLLPEFRRTGYSGPLRVWQREW